ncbi:MAG TPA: alanine racemase [Gemmatimonadaceae bacterium]|nr:alanine racemase [Gemmatimonadaceae bacterium]
MHTTRAWVDIDLGALLRNGAAIAKHSGVPLIPMVKADAYGLGVVPVVRTLAKLDPFGFGVATIEEGRELRESGAWRPILLFTPILTADFAAVREANLVPTLGTADTITAWIDAGGGPWHLAIDTGVSRAGIRWDRIGDVADATRRHPPEGACTHFHSAELDDGSMAVQEQRFRDAIAALPERPAMLHAENSAAAVRHSPSPWSVVRPGVFLYGVGSGPRASLQPEPVAHLRARVVEMRDLQPGDSVGYDATWRSPRASRVATLAIGYADGYRRSLGNAAEALLNGRRVRVVGTVMMDMTVVDVTDVPCAVGDVATLFGVDGGDVLPVEEVAARAALSPYELLTGLRQRVIRVYA